MMRSRDNLYIDIILDPLRKSAEYLPKMGGSDEVDLERFTALYRCITGWDSILRSCLLPTMRQGYKSADSGRQDADLANAVRALGRGYLPVRATASRW